MQKFIVVSSNNNPDYLFYLPYMEKAWNSYGWTLCVMVTDDVDISKLKYNNLDTHIYKLPNIPGLRTESIAQAGRLYAANYLPADSFIMTSDMDLLPLSDYWKPNEEQTTIYGHDLTDYSFYPMGYIAQSSEKWKQAMILTGDTCFDMLRDAHQYAHLAFAQDWESWWNWDWTMITNRMKPNASQYTFITRGRQSNGFAYGRIDRGNSMAHVEGELIDAHCENNNVQHPDKLKRFLQIFETRYGNL